MGVVIMIVLVDNLTYRDLTAALVLVVGRVQLSDASLRGIHSEDALPRRVLRTCTAPWTRVTSSVFRKSRGHSGYVREKSGKERSGERRAAEKLAEKRVHRIM